jgi:hypothetical protein
MKLHMLRLLAGALLLLGASVTSASLIGATYDNASVDGSLTLITASPIAFTDSGGGPDIGICVDGPSTDHCSSTGLSIGIDIGSDIAGTFVTFTFFGSTGGGGNFYFDLTNLNFSPSGQLTGINPAGGGLNAGIFGWTDFGADFIRFTGGDNGAGDIDAIGGVTIRFDLDVTETAPEPGMLALMGLGLAGMGFARRRIAR